jgi:hypothetical protein
MPVLRCAHRILHLFVWLVHTSKHLASCLLSNRSRRVCLYHYYYSVKCVGWIIVAILMQPLAVRYKPHSPQVLKLNPHTQKLLGSFTHFGAVLLFVGRPSMCEPHCTGQSMWRHAEESKATQAVDHNISHFVVTRQRPIRARSACCHGRTSTCCILASSGAWFYPTAHILIKTQVVPQRSVCQSLLLSLCSVTGYAAIYSCGIHFCCKKVINASELLLVKGLYDYHRLRRHCCHHHYHGKNIWDPGSLLVIFEAG